MKQELQKPVKQVMAPLPGVFYRRPSPGAAPSAVPGAGLAAGATIGLVEAIKGFFPVEAPSAGKVVRFTVEDGAKVDADNVIAEIG